MTTTTTNPNDHYTWQSTYGGLLDGNCDRGPLWNGGAVAWCGYVYVSPGFGYYPDGSPVYENGSISTTVSDACGNVVASFRDNPATQYSYPSSGTYGWYWPSTIPWNEAPACDGTWSVTYSGYQYFPDGNVVSSSVTQNTTLVSPDAPSALEAYAQSYGGTTIHGRQGDPVDSFTGAFNFAPGPDASMAALGEPLVMNRTYASNDPTVGPLGPGWSFSFDASVAVDLTTGNVTYHDPSGSEQMFVPNGSGGYTPPLGVHSALAKNADGTFALTLKNQTRSAFNTNGKLASITDRNSQGVALAYNAANQLVAASGSGRTLTFGYDPSSGRLNSVALSDGRSVSYAYNATGQLVSYTDANQQTTRYGYDAGGRLNSIQDPNGNYAARLVYDPASGRVTSQEDANNNTTTFSWNASTNTATITDPRNNAWTDVYLNGYLVEGTDPLGDQTRYSWDANGNLARTSDPDGHTTLFAYDTNGNLTQKTAPVTGTTAPKVESYSYNTRNDVVFTRDFDGNYTSYGYDVNGNPTTIQRPDVNTGATITATTNIYNGNGTLATSADAYSDTTVYGYDAQGDVISKTDPANNKTTSTYDGAGRLVSTVDPRGNVAGANPDSYRTRRTYDNNDQLTTTTDPLGDVTQYGYDPGGRLHTVTDPRNNVTAYSYDAANHQISVQGPITTIPPTVSTYDPDGNLHTRTDANSNVTTYAYDLANRLTSVGAPTTGTTQYSYDPAGQVLSQTAPSGRQVTFTRDPRGLVTQTTYSDGTASVSYTYDDNGNRLSMTDAAGTVTYKYDVLNLPTTVTRGSDIFAYSYDNNGRVTARTFPGQTADNFRYDAAGRISLLSRGTANIAQYSYDPSTGNVITTLGNGIVETQGIDAAGRPSQVKAVLGSTTLSQSAYTLDADGNPIAITDQTGASNTYTYDPINRLGEVCFTTTSCTSPTDYIKWTYDGNNNRLTETRPAGTTTYVYNGANQLTTRSGLAGAATYTRDADGNVSSDGTNSYTWNAAGQLTTAGNKTKPVSYTYDGDGHRTKSVAGSTTTNYLWDPVSADLALERDNSNNLLRRYTYGSTLLGYTTGGADYYYLIDDLGSVRAVTNSTGALQWTYSYEPYGGAKTTTQVTRTAPANPLQFTGQYKDNTQYDLRAREYDPTNGSFLSADPAGIPGDSYGYASANPMVFNDPTGLKNHGFLDFVHAVATGVAVVAGGATAVCTIIVVCSPIDTITAPLALGAAAVSAATSNSTIRCLSGKGGCGAAIVSGALIAAAGAFGLSEVAAEGAAADAVDGVAADGAAGGADGVVTVRHFTNDVGVSQITESGSLRAGTYVTLPSEIPAGASSDTVEKLLEIEGGKGANYIDVQTTLSNLGMPSNGPTTSGGLWQRILVDPVALGGSEFDPL